MKQKKIKILKFNILCCDFKGENYENCKKIKKFSGSQYGNWNCAGRRNLLAAGFVKNLIKIVKNLFIKINI